MISVESKSFSNHIQIDDLSIGYCHWTHELSDARGRQLDFDVVCVVLWRFLDFSVMFAIYHLLLSLSRAKLHQVFYKSEWLSPRDIKFLIFLHIQHQKIVSSATKIQSASPSASFLLLTSFGVNENTRKFLMRLWVTFVVSFVHV